MDKAALLRLIVWLTVRFSDGSAKWRQMFDCPTQNEGVQMLVVDTRGQGEQTAKQNEDDDTSAPIMKGKYRGMARYIFRIPQEERSCIGVACRHNRE